MWPILGLVSLPYQSKAHARRCLVEERDPHVMPFFVSSSPPTDYPHLCALFHYLAALWPFLSWQTPARTPRCHTWGSPPPCRVGSSSLPAHSPPCPMGSHGVLHMAPTALRTLHVGTTLISSLPGDRLQGRKRWKAVGISPVCRRCSVNAACMAARKELESRVWSLIALCVPSRVYPKDWLTVGAQRTVVH